MLSFFLHAICSLLIDHNDDDEAILAIYYVSLASSNAQFYESSGILFLGNTNPFY